MPARKDGKGYIYKITNKISGKCYIGETGQSSVKKRWDGHLSKIKKGSGCPALRDAITKYGIENFSFDILCECETLDERMEKEIYYIKEFDCMILKGYNILPGGHYSGGFIGKKHSEETKAKLSKTSKEYYADPEVRKKSSERAKILNKKYNFSELIKNSEKFKKAKEEGRVGSGIKSIICKEKLSETITNYFKKEDQGKLINILKHREYMAKARGVKVAQYDLEENFIKVFESINEATRSVGLKSCQSIQRVLKGECKKAGGFIWKKYVEPEKPDNVIEYI